MGMTLSDDVRNLILALDLMAGGAILFFNRRYQMAVLKRTWERIR